MCQARCHLSEPTHHIIQSQEDAPALVPSLRVASNLNTAVQYLPIWTVSAPLLANPLMGHWPWPLWIAVSYFKNFTGILFRNILDMLITFPTPQLPMGLTITEITWYHVALMLFMLFYSILEWWLLDHWLWSLLLFFRPLVLSPMTLEELISHLVQLWSCVCHECIITSLCV
jgi:hypothetical protein